MEQKRSLNLGGFSSFVVKPFLFILALAAMISSMILTVCFILNNVAVPDFAGTWFFKPDCLLYIAKIMLGCSITVAQGAVLVALKLSDRDWYHWTHFAYLTTWFFCLSLSVYITILTLHTGLQQGVIEAKTNSQAYQNLLDRREMIVNSLKEKERQQKEMFNQKWWTKGNEWYSGEIQILQGQLRSIDEQIANYGKEHRDEFVSGEGTYQTFATDMKFIFNWQTSTNKIAVILKYFYLLFMSLSLDLSGSLLMAFSVGNENLVPRNRARVSELTKRPLNLKTADAEDIRLLLPGMPMILDKLTTWKTRLFFYGGSDGGKTTAVLAFLHKFGRKMIREKVRVYVVDPKPKFENKWPDWITAVIGNGFDLEAIRDFFNWVRKEVFEPRKDMTPDEIKHQPDVVIVLDEILQLTKDFKKVYGENFADYWFYFLTYARTLKIYFYAVSQSDRVESMGIQGMGDVVHGFAAKMHFILEGMHNPPFRYVVVERAKQKDRLFQTVPVSLRRRMKISALVTGGIKKVTEGVTNLIPYESDKVTESGDKVTWSDTKFVTGDIDSDIYGDKKCHPVISASYEPTVTKSDKSDTVTLGGWEKVENGVKSGVFEGNTSDTISPGDNGDKSDKNVKKASFELDIDTEKFKYFKDGDKQKELLRAYMSLGKKATPTGALIQAFNQKNRTMYREAKIVIDAFNDNGSGKG